MVDQASWHDTAAACQQAARNAGVRFEGLVYNEQFDEYTAFFDGQRRIWFQHDWQTEYYGTLIERLTKLFKNPPSPPAIRGVISK